MDDDMLTLLRAGKSNWLASVCELSIEYSGEHPIFEFDDAMGIVAYEAIEWFN